MGQLINHEEGPNIREYCMAKEIFNDLTQFSELTSFGIVCVWNKNNLTI